MDKRIEEVKIEVPEGYEIDRENSSFERIIFKKKVLPKSWKEFCEMTHVSEREAWISATSGINTIGYKKERSEAEDANLLATADDARQHLALLKLHRLRDCYRQGWKPNWAESSPKYFICVVAGSFIVDTCYRTRKFLSFQSLEVAKDFATNFPDLLKQAEDLI